MKPFMYNKGQSFFEFLFYFSYVDNFTHYSIIHRQNTKLENLYLDNGGDFGIFLTSFREISKINKSGKLKKKKLNHDHDFSLTWEIVAVSHTFIWHCLLTNFFLKKS